MILIVDDNHENRFSLKNFLMVHGFEVDTAVSGEDALKKVLMKNYSLIILDVQMPEMDGFEVAEAISGYSKSKDIPIIFLSAANTHKKFIAQGYISGGIDYITKPFDPDILLLKIQTFYRLSEQTQRLNAIEKVLREEVELRKAAENILEKRVEERTAELIKANQRLKESNSQLQQFAFIASHDLQEPLRKIEMFSNLVLERCFDESKSKAYIGKIARSASRLRNLITDLLDYSRMSVPKSFVMSDLGEIVENVIADLEVPAEKCEIVIGDLPQVEAIPSQMHQLFQNVIGNSIKFSRTGVINRIEISAEFVADRSIDSRAVGHSDFTRITIRDKGIGFSNQFRDRIFDIFQRLNGRANFEGTGIGLAIVKKVIERHDGLIAASGHENEGAHFTIVLPLRQTSLMMTKTSADR